MNDSMFEAGRARRDLRKRAVARIRERPLLCAGLSAAAGFVVGGGIATGTGLRIIRRALAITVQIAVIPALLARLRETLLDELDEIAGRMRVTTEKQGADV